MPLPPPPPSRLTDSVALSTFTHHHLSIHSCAAGELLLGLGRLRGVAAVLADTPEDCREDEGLRALADELAASQVGLPESAET